MQYREILNFVIVLLGFIGTVFGEIKENKYLLYVFGFIFLFYGYYLIRDTIQRKQKELSIISYIGEKRKENFQVMLDMFSCIIGCCCNIIFAYVSVHEAVVFVFALLFVIVYQVVVRKICN